jgi:hypothetical protein
VPVTALIELFPPWRRGLVWASIQDLADRPKGRFTRPHIEHMLDVPVAGRWIMPPDLLNGGHINQIIDPDNLLKPNDLLARSW